MTLCNILHRAVLIVYMSSNKLFVFIWPLLLPSSYCLINLLFDRVLYFTGAVLYLKFTYFIHFIVFVMLLLYLLHYCAVTVCVR